MEQSQLPNPAVGEESPLPQSVLVDVDLSRLGSVHQVRFEGLVLVYEGTVGCGLAEWQGSYSRVLRASL